MMQKEVCHLKTNKNTFKYLCFIFVFAIIHSCFPRLDKILTFIFLAGCLFLSAQYTGFPKLFRKAVNCAAAIILSFLFGCFFPMLERSLWNVLHTGSYFSIQPLVRIPGLILCVLLALLICRLSTVGSKSRFPRWGFLVICFIPPLIYYFMGIFLTLIDIESFEYALCMAQIPGMYTGKIFFLYNDELYLFIRDISIGWSIFCMMKYNQSMKIKALLEMQAKQL